MYKILNECVENQYYICLGNIILFSKYKVVILRGKVQKNESFSLLQHYLLYKSSLCLFLILLGKET